MHASNIMTIDILAMTMFRCNGDQEHSRVQSDSTLISLKIDSSFFSGHLDLGTAYFHCIYGLLLYCPQRRDLAELDHYLYPRSPQLQVTVFQ